MPNMMKVQYAQGIIWMGDPSRVDPMDGCLSPMGSHPWLPKGFPLRGKEEETAVAISIAHSKIPPRGKQEEAPRGTTLSKVCCASLSRRKMLRSGFVACTLIPRRGIPLGSRGWQPTARCVTTHVSWTLEGSTNRLFKSMPNIMKGHMHGRSYWAIPPGSDRWMDGWMDGCLVTMGSHPWLPKGLPFQGKDREAGRGNDPWDNLRCVDAWRKVRGRDSRHAL